MLSLDFRSTALYKGVTSVVLVYIVSRKTGGGGGFLPVPVLIFTSGEIEKKRKTFLKKEERVWRLWSQLLFHSTRNQLACVVCCFPLPARPTSSSTSPIFLFLFGFFILSAHTSDNIPSSKKKERRRKELAAF
jgi:hypothetical protein